MHITNPVPYISLFIIGLNLPALLQILNIGHYHSMNIKEIISVAYFYIHAGNHGRRYIIKAHSGKMLFIDFWATWCLPCLFQLPEFDKLSEKYPDILVIGISIDQNEKLWVKRLKKDGMPAHIQEVLADPYVVGDAWDITSIPRFLLIDENFRIINAFAPRPSDREKIEPLLAR